MSRQSENAKTLASLLGTSEEEAAQMLDARVALTADPSDGRAIFAASLVSEILGRTITTVIVHGATEVDAEIVFGAAEPLTNRYLRLCVDESETLIGFEVQPAELWPAAPDILLLVAACYATGRVLRLALGERLKVSGLPLEQTFVVTHDAILSAARGWMSQDVRLEDTYLAGGGAIGNGFAFALRFLNVSGTLVIVDPDTVSDGNLNRCVLFDGGDLNTPKVKRLAEKLSAAMPNLDVRGDVLTLQEFGKTQDSSAWLKRLIIGVDSPRVRRHLQGEIPGEVFDASTTGVEEVVFHHHKQPTDTACLSCIYRETESELARERHIAESLGVSLEDVKEHHVSATAAAEIQRRYPMETTDLIGLPYDSLFKALCSEGKLMTAEGKQVLAPFAFVSVLAGAMLAIELARRLASGVAASTFNYWRLNPWHPPVVEMRATRPRHPACEFCGMPVFLNIARSLWS